MHGFVLKGKVGAETAQQARIQYPKLNLPIVCNIMFTDIEGAY